MKSYMTCREQVSFLKARGLVFKVIDEKKAQHLLSHNVYFHKLCSYKHFFNRYSQTKSGEDNYNGLDFADLYDLYDLDKLLREQFVDICSEIELFFKVFIMRHVEMSPIHDEYFYYTIENIDKKYRINNRMEKRINDFDDLYSKKNLIKYPEDKPIWVLHEYLTFGEVLELFTKYSRKNKLKEYNFLIDMLYTSKTVRNITAHGNKLFISNDNLVSPNEKLIEMFRETHNIHIQGKQISTQFMDNLISTLYIYKTLVSKEYTDERMNFLFMKLHTFSKSRKLYSRNQNERFTIDMQYLYKIVNKMY